MQFCNIAVNIVVITCYVIAQTSSTWNLQATSGQFLNKSVDFNIFAAMNG